MDAEDKPVKQNKDLAPLGVIQQKNNESIYVLRFNLNINYMANKDFATLQDQSSCTSFDITSSARSFVLVGGEAECTVLTIRTVVAIQ